MNAATIDIPSRVAVLETRVTHVETIETRIETKLDGLKNWMLGVMVSGFGALSLAVVGYLLQRK